LIVCSHGESNNIWWNEVNGKKNCINGKCTRIENVEEISRAKGCSSKDIMKSISNGLGINYVCRSGNWNPDVLNRVIRR